jgi:hypothetical protein
LTNPVLTKSGSITAILISVVISWLIANVAVDHDRMELGAMLVLGVPPIIGTVSLLLFLLIDWGLPQTRLVTTIIFVSINIICGTKMRVDSFVPGNPIVIHPSDTVLYNIRLTDTVILPLRQLDSGTSLQRYLGNPLTQNIHQIDHKSDDFPGAFIKNVEYDGLKLRLFSPPEDGQNYWVEEIIISSNKYKTTEGVTIGDDLQKVTQSYPWIRKMAGENENMYYITDQGNKRSIEMEFQNNKLKMLHIYRSIN